MPVLLSHTTALEAMRRPELRWRLAKGERCAAEVPPKAPDASELQALEDAFPLLEGLELPLHVLVSKSRVDGRGARIHAHLHTGPLPPGSTIQLAEGVHIVSPEFLAIQMAPGLTQLELAFLLSELCGLYAIAPWLERGMYLRERPLTTPESIKGLLRRAGDVRGSRLVADALKISCARSRSPQETRLFLRLVLPQAKGGYALPVVSLNEPMEVRRIIRELGIGTREPDILLLAPEGTEEGGRRGVAFEYLGPDHKTDEQHARDLARHNELEAAGLTEYWISAEQYNDIDYLDGVVFQARRDIGLARQRPGAVAAARLRERREQLRDELARIDGIAWNGREREGARRQAREKPESSKDETGILAEEGRYFEEVPLSAYGEG